MATWSEKAKVREFRLWEYHAGHGCLVLRSPKDEASATNLDLLCFDVVYVELPRVLAGMHLAEPTPDETDRVRRALGGRTEPWSLRILISNGSRYMVAARQFVEQEHDKEPMASFLATRHFGRERQTRRARAPR